MLNGPWFCPLGRRNSTFTLLSERIDVVRILGDPSIVAVAVACQHCFITYGRLSLTGSDSEEDDTAEEQLVWIANDGDSSSEFEESS